MGYLYGPDAFGWDMLLEALDVDGYPPPDVRLEARPGYPPAIKVDWRNGAYMTLRLGPASVHFEDLCSYAGKAHPTGLYRQLIENLEPLFADLGVPVATCEPSDAFARQILARSGAQWEPHEDGRYWLWWIGEWDARTQIQALTTAREVAQERIDQAVAGA